MLEEKQGVRNGPSIFEWEIKRRKDLNENKLSGSIPTSSFLIHPHNCALTTNTYYELTLLALVTIREAIENELMLIKMPSNSTRFFRCLFFITK